MPLAGDLTKSSELRLYGVLRSSRAAAWRRRGTMRVPPLESRPAFLVIAR
jgi:hypothetical protein